MDKCGAEEEIELAINILVERTNLTGSDIHNLQLAIAGEGRLMLDVECEDKIARMHAARVWPK